MFYILIFLKLLKKKESVLVNLLASVDLAILKLTKLARYVLHIVI